jgi:hypothetical protein
MRRFGILIEDIDILSRLFLKTVPLLAFLDTYRAETYSTMPAYCNSPNFQWSNFFRTFLSP